MAIQISLKAARINAHPFFIQFPDPVLIVKQN